MPARSPERRGDRVEPIRVGGGQHDGVRRELTHGLRQRLERRVAAEERDPPAVLAQREAEDQEAEIVPLLRRACEHRARPTPAIPAACQPEEPAAHEM